MSEVQNVSSEPQWYVVDHDRDDEIVRGPYLDATTAGAVRTELERRQYADKGNLWIVTRDPR